VADTADWIRVHDIKEMRIVCSAVATNVGPAVRRVMQTELAVHDKHPVDRRFEEGFHG